MGKILHNNRAQLILVEASRGVIHWDDQPPINPGRVAMDDADFAFLKIARHRKTPKGDDDKGINGFYLAVATLAAQFFIVWCLTKFPWLSNNSSSGACWRLTMR